MFHHFDVTRTRVDVRRLADDALRVAVGFLVALGMSFVIVAETPVANLMARPLLRVRSAPAKADIAVVLAAGRYLDGSLTQAAIERTVTGVRLYYRGVVPVLMFTGGPCCGQSATT